MRFPSLASVVAHLAVLFACIAAPGQTGPSKPGELNTANPQGILHQLPPDDVPPPSLNLKPADKARAVRLRVAAKQDETGWHKQRAIYLLLTLGHDYEHNRNELLNIWHNGGDDGTMELLIWLYKQGHREFLHTILAAGPHSDGALAEELGVFFADELASEPREFLGALSTFLPDRQRAICTLAGEEDGGGMGPQTERQVLDNLKGISGEVAGRCARGVRVGNRSTDDANREEQEEIQNAKKK